MSIPDGLRCRWYLLPLQIRNPSFLAIVSLPRHLGRSYTLLRQPHYLSEEHLDCCHSSHRYVLLSSFSLHRLYKFRYYRYSPLLLLSSIYTRESRYFSIADVNLGHRKYVLIFSNCPIVFSNFPICFNFFRNKILHEKISFDLQFQFITWISILIVWHCLQS